MYFDCNPSFWKIGDPKDITDRTWHRQCLIQSSYCTQERQWVVSGLFRQYWTTCDGYVDFEAAICCASSLCSLDFLRNWKMAGVCLCCVKPQASALLRCRLSRLEWHSRSVSTWCVLGCMPDRIIWSWRRGLPWTRLCGTWSTFPAELKGLTTRHA